MTAPSPDRGVWSEENRGTRERIVELLKKAYWMEIETVMIFIAISTNPDGVRAQEVTEVCDGVGRATQDMVIDILRGEEGHLGLFEGFSGEFAMERPERARPPVGAAGIERFSCCSPRSFRLEQSRLQRELHDLGAVAQPHLLHELVPVSVHRAG